MAGSARQPALAQSLVIPEGEQRQMCGMGVSKINALDISIV
jgi:hypothetical protein